MPERAQQVVTWHHVVWRVRAGLLVFLFSAFALLAAPQLKDMLAGLATFDNNTWEGWGEAFAFHVSLFLMAFFLWYWARSVLLAAFRIPDTRGARDALAARAGIGEHVVTVFDWLPRLLFAGTVISAAIAAFRSERYLQGAIALLWGALFYWVLARRLDLMERFGFKGMKDAPPERARARNWWKRLWRRLRDLLDYGPFGSGLTAALLIVATGVFFISLALAFVPGGIAYSTYPARWFPGASAAFYLLGLAVGPLTALTYVLDRVEARITVFGAVLKLRYVPALTLLAAVMTYGPIYMNLHAVRIVTDPGAMKPEARVSLADYFRQWTADCAPNDGTPVRPVIVAVSGGASKAGLWGARVLTLVDKKLANAKGMSIFAVSSVSGGSLGTGAYMTLRAGDAAAANTPACRLADLPPDDQARFGAAMVKAIREDAIGPTLAGLILGDMPRSIAGLVVAPIVKLHNDWTETRWVFRGNDRAEALERAFEINWRDYGIDAFKDIPGAPNAFGLDRPFLSLFYGSGGKLRGYVPAWIANGTDQNNGNRIVTTPFKLNQERFCMQDGRWYGTGAACARPLPSFLWGKFGPIMAPMDALAVLKADIPASTAADNTDRFPVISPSGELTPAVYTKAPYAAQVIDGGYFENEGLTTAMEIANWLKAYGPALVGRPVYPVIVEATADAQIPLPKPGVPPSISDQVKERHVVRCGNPRPENPAVGRGVPRSAQLLAPLMGLASAVTGHAAVALKTAQQDYCDEAGHQAFFNMYLYNARDFDLPLNWVLSARVGDFIWSESEGGLSACWNRAEEANMQESFDADPADWKPDVRRKQVYVCKQGKVVRANIPQLPGPLTTISATP